MNAHQTSPSSSVEAPVSASTPAPWGHEHPNCRGEAAIAFFTADLARTIESTLSGKSVDASVLADAQRAIDRLLAIYVALRAAPHAFEGQTIKLDVAMQARADGPPFPYVALTTSERLENLIIEMQERERLGLGG